MSGFMEPPKAEWCKYAELRDIVSTDDLPTVYSPCCGVGCFFL
jgi:hypothetical protein